MSGIQYLTINELIKNGEANLQTGPFGTQLKASDYVEEGIPVINVRNIGYGNIRDAKLEYLDEKMAAKLSVHKLVANDIVFGRKGASDRHVFIKEENSGWIQGSDCLRLRISSDRVYPRYLSYFFTTKPHMDWMEAMCSFGATMTSLNQDIVKRITFPIFSFPVQQKIAAILSAYDDLIENNNKRIALLEKAAEEIYREWFVRMRFPGWEQVKFVKGIPERWEYKSMRELIEFHIGGGWGEENVSIDFSEGANVIRGTDLPSINSGDFPKEVFRYHKASNYKSRKLHSGDIIFEVAGGSKDQWLGRTAIMTNNILAYYGDRVICASFCKLIRFDKNKISPYFMKYFLNLYYSTGLVSTYQVQSTGISNYQFEGFLSGQKVLVPSDDLKKAFDKQIIPLVEQKDKLSLANILLKETRDLLLSRLISGKLSVEALDIRFPPSMIAQ